MNAQEFIQQARELDKEKTLAITSNLDVIKKTLSNSVDNLNKGRVELSKDAINRVIIHLDSISLLLNPPHNPKP